MKCFKGGLALWKVLRTVLYNQIPPNSTLLKIEYISAFMARTNYMFCAGFFHARKTFLTFFKKMSEIALCRTVLCGKREIPTFAQCRKGV